MLERDAAGMDALGETGQPLPRARAEAAPPESHLSPAQRASHEAREGTGWDWLTGPIWTIRLLVGAGACAVGYAAQRVTRVTPVQELRGLWLCRFLVGMGPLAIKVGQLLGAQVDLLPPQMLKQVRELQDNVPATAPERLNRLLATTVDGGIGQLFATWQNTPVASASIAQVHKASLPSGEIVAVKIVRPGVRGQLRDTLSALRLLARMAQLVSRRARQLNLIAHIQELEVILIEQTDMRIEAAHQDRIRANFSGHPHVRVPAPIRALCTRDMLVMEWMDGIRGLQSHEVQVPPAVLAWRLQDAFYTMVYLHGFFHADPHPGNVMFSSKGEIILLDFGLVGELTEEQKWGLSSFYYAAIRKEWQNAVDRFTRHFVVNGEAALGNAAYRSRLLLTLRTHFEERTRKWSTVGFVADANDVLRKHGLRFTTVFTKIVLAFLSGEGFVTLIDPRIDIWANARRFTDRASPYMSDAVQGRFEAWFGDTMAGSLRWRERADRSLVAPTHLDRYMVPNIHPLFIRRAHGSRLEDIDGHEYIDLQCGFGAQYLGHAHPVVAEAIARAAEAGSLNAIGNCAEVELAEELAGALPSIERVIFANSGTEAVLQALRLCKAARGRAKVAKFEGHYHGFSDQGIVSSWFVFSGPANRPRAATGMPGTDRATAERTLVLQYGYMEELDRLSREADDLACVICEPYPAAGGDIDVAFLRALRGLCDRHGIPLIFDEVVSGFRVAFGGAQALAGVEPDLTCLGKIIGGGLPCGAVGGRRALVDLAKSSHDPFRDFEQKVFVGGTMSGNSITCAAGLAAVRHLRDNRHIYADVDGKSRRLGKELAAVAAEAGVAYQVGAARSIITMSFDHRKPRLVREQQTGGNYRANLALAYYMRQHGVYMSELHTMLLCAAHSDDDIDRTVEAFAGSLRDMMNDGLFVT
ncbi:aminotransferase class III-fold pyridoxal phosphate-dependent enzyme [Mesorhizobium sp. INR15]|uniref:aminotransferase class III-fold pyridoxal phosphate-dependent enzyme n=1 Tax=Mesorhizobium sp. INR15 TaxID=2654248 RepID=UPI0018964A44|nr:aminotransferase class III-fold pyridoxal phosphate-dependent enzyme [Mesorhizobium sp. INR15]QPC91919.1 aminotransferase class III-fold pyridoxal phosphate-dependent enzyme [Mesorhizobium sp. INR15]